MSREMKYSGIEWIGYIPKYWTITKLKNIIDFISGYAFKSELFTISDNNKKVITIKSFNTKEIILDNLSYSNESLKFPTKYLLKNNDILFAMSGGTTGKNLLIEQVDDLYYINQRVGIIRSSFSKFIYYYINTGLFSEYINLFSSGSAQPNISATDIQNFIIALPEKETIKKIEIYINYQLKIISNIIDTTYQSIEELKKYKQSLITEAVTKGIDPNVEMKESGNDWIGSIPSNWSVRKIKHDFNLKGRIGWQGLTSNEYQTVGPYLIMGTDFKKGIIRWDSCVRISEERFEEAPDIHIKENDLLITKDGTIGKVALATNVPKKVSLNSGVLLIREKLKNTINKKFMYYNLLSNMFWNWYNSNNQGASTIKHLYQGQFYNYSYAIPLLHEQQQIVQYLDDKVSTIDRLIEDKTKVIKELENYKKSLIYEYVTGKKEV
ncbi:TPA: restriction endonuclease subunit S [Staphylococcus aureus]|nr:restriction endonuclease subunit S [Staphylococcus aureus]